MLLITCPWCGPREQSEFSCGGEAHIVRPVDTDALLARARVLRASVSGRLTRRELGAWRRKGRP